MSEEKKIEKNMFVVNEAYEAFLKEHFPVGSFWYDPGGDDGFEVLGYEREIITPDLYKHSRVEFYGPSLRVIRTAQVLPPGKPYEPELIAPNKVLRMVRFERGQPIAVVEALRETFPNE